MSHKNCRDLKVYAALTDDINNGHVWVKDDSLKKPRGIVRITIHSKRRGVYCEALQIDQNFLRAYSTARTLEIGAPESAIVMSFWYRGKLGISATNTTHPISLTSALPIWGHFWACMHHPQIVVRVALILGFVGVVLSGIGAIPIVIGWIGG